MSEVGRQIIYSMVNVSKIHPPQKQVLKDIYISFYYGAKIGVLGLNGSGKSSLLRIMAGIDKDYLGEIHQSPGYSIGLLEQEPQLDENKTVIEIVREGAQKHVDILNEFEEVNNKFMDEEILNDPDKMDKLINRQAQLQDLIDQHDLWNLDTRLELAMDARKVIHPSIFYQVVSVVV
jgi:sulfate-transporting ATPase